MALTSTMYTATVELADVDRGVYETLDLRLAMHPSESAEYFATRLLAYCLEYSEGIEFSGGVSSGDDPAILIRDLTGRVTGWIEVGMPDAERVHRAAKFADRVAIYTNRDVCNVLAELARRKIHRAEEIPIYSFGRGFIEEFASHLERRMKIAISVNERHVYADIDGHALSTVIEESKIGAVT